MKIDNFFAELKRRNVYKVAVAYAVIAWLLIQIATQIFPFFGIPSWGVRLVILLLALGFPIAVVFSWIFELTPEGLRRTEEVAPRKSITRSTGQKLDFVIIGVLLTVIVLLLLGRSRPASLSAVGVAPEKSIAVLPFENMSDNKENAFFAHGVQDDILTALSKIANLKVISRTSVMSYPATTGRNLREIGKALGVAHVLEGSVRRSGGKVRVKVQLIDARTNLQLWAEQFDREWADIFAIQSEIARKIADQLRATLSPKEQAVLQSKPTLDPAAYDFYLQAKEIWRGLVSEASEGEAIQQQIALLNQAVARDSAFVPALCLLARAHLQAYWWNHDHTPARLELVREAIEAAARLQPDAGEVHLARALFYYWGHRDYAPALAELALARRSLPNDAEVLVFTGAIERRQGHWEQAPQAMEKALVLDPRNPTIAFEVSHTYHALRRFEDERRILDDILVWKPDDFGIQILPAQSYLDQRADPAKMQTVAFGEVARTADPNVLAEARLSLALAQHDYRAAERALADYRLADFSWEGFVTPREYFEGRIARGLGEANRANAAFLRARERAAATANARPEEVKALIVLALIDAALGRREDALREGERAVEGLPVATDAVDGASLLGRLAVVCAEVNATDRALEVLERAATLPHGLYYGDLKLDERFDSLRNDPRFQTILASLAPKATSP